MARRSMRTLNARLDCCEKDRGDAISLWHSANGVIKSRDQEIAKHKEAIHDLTQQKLSEMRRADRAERDAEKIGFALADAKKLAGTRNTETGNLNERIDQLRVCLGSIIDRCGDINNEIRAANKLMDEPYKPAEPPF